MDTTIAPVSSSQHINEKIISPYLRVPVGVGISNIRRVIVAPSKPLEHADTRYDFVLPNDSRNVLNLSGILLQVQGRIRRKDPNTLQYVDLVGKEDCALVANSLHSLFSSGTVTIGTNQVCDRDLFFYFFIYFFSHVALQLLILFFRFICIWYK